MPKRTKKKTSIKQKQKVKVIVNVNNKTARRRRYAPRQVICNQDNRNKLLFSNPV
jgi:hypothetical protein